MDDLGFNGSGSRFNTRFGSGGEITAASLNAMSYGVQAGLPMPYLGGGANVSFTPGGSTITALNDPQGMDSPTWFKARTLKVEGQWGVQVARGYIIVKNGYEFGYGGPDIGSLKQFFVKGFAVYPTDALMAGTDTTSPWASDGGYVKINNATDGGSNSWGIYIVRNQNSLYGLPGYTWLSVIADGSDALAKSEPDLGTGVGDQYWQNGMLVDTLNVYNPDGSVTTTQISYPFSTVIACQYLKAQRIKLATLTWNGTLNDWDIVQNAEGGITLPQYIFYGGAAYSTVGAPSYIWDGWPLNYAANNAWDGSWTGYDKSQTTAQTDVVTP